VLYLGPVKTHCTADLQKCYLKSGMQLLQIELDTTSSYNNSIVHLGANSENRFALCKLEDVWRCTGTYNVPSDATSVDLVIAPSYDDYGNMLESSMEREIIVDNNPPKNISAITSINSNNNNNCSVSGDTLTLNVRVNDTSPELKMYVNTSEFTTQQIQTGACTLADDNTWDCALTVKDFSSIPVSTTQNITVEDLAGNILSIPYDFEVCQSTSSAVPNVISQITQDKDVIPSVDRRTASTTPVETYIPLNINVQNGATPAILMYLTVDNCVATGSNGLGVIGSEYSLIPNYGNNPIMVLNIGNVGALLPENELNINCTISARVKIGQTVFKQEEKKAFTVKVKTYNNPLGSIDTATNEEINTVRKHLRDLDSEIKNRKKVDDILGNMCKIAQGVGEADTILQATKAVLYGVLILVAQVVPVYGDSTAQGVWTTVQTSLGSIHNIVIHWIWPPGLLPKSGGTKLGTGIVIKYMCTVYTCKQLDIGTYLGLMVEFTQNQIQDMAALGKIGTSDYSVPVTTPITITDKSPIVEVKDNTFGPGLNLEPSNAFSPLVLSSPTPIEKKALTDSTVYMSSALNGHQWIVNPYASIHYDDTCNPAIIYNLKKDRQISCMYLNCLDNQVAYGLPKIICDGNYKINKCLYLDSADYVLNGRGSAINAFWRGLTSALKASALGMAIQFTYIAICPSDYIEQGYLKDVVLRTGGWHSAICGIIGSGLAVKEITDFLHNPFSDLRTMDPAANKDYCSGLVYTEATDVPVEGNLGYFNK